MTNFDETCRKIKTKQLSFFGRVVERNIHIDECYEKRKS